MCLFALAANAAGKSDVPAYYAQPRRYSLDYSTGIRATGGRSDIQGYCIKLGGRRLYQMT